MKKCVLLGFLVLLLCSACGAADSASGTTDAATSEASDPSDTADASGAVSDDDTNNTPDPASLAAALASGLSFDEAPSEIPSEDISLYMDAPENAEGAFYKSGSTAEAVAVFSCANTDTAKATYDALAAYLEEQTSMFEAYDAEEVDRLAHAYLEQKDGTVIMCINSDKDAIEKIIEENLKK